VVLADCRGRLPGFDHGGVESVPIPHRHSLDRPASEGRPDAGLDALSIGVKCLGGESLPLEVL
jgi:hypothetical protein